ncbi:MAG: acyltransferase family protein [Bacteroidaceae bacterium]|nr:acyltransferase family protein [Bacteroidaceae bacterium]
MNKRLDYIDAAKGVAILCITFLHFERGVIPGWLNVWIGMFMISAFYVTSGWVTGINDKPITVKELFKKRIRQLGMPYLWFSALIILFDVLWVALGLMESGILLRDIYKTIVLRGIGTLWFLPVLLIGECIFTSIKNSKRVWMWAAIGLAITLLVNHLYNSCWSPIRDNSELNKILDAPLQPIVRGLYAWPIIAIGYLLGKKWGKTLLEMNKIKLLSISAMLFAISFILIIKPPFNIYYINGVLSNTLPAIAFMCLFATLCNNIIERFFTYWGVNSLILMCTHFSITMEVLMAFDKHILHHTTFEGPRTIIYFVICIILTYPLVWLFNGKLRFMLGRK